MKAEELLALGLRMAGVYLVLTTSRVVMDTVYYLKVEGMDDASSGWLLGQLGFTSLYVLASGVLLLFPLTMARLLLSGIEADKVLQIENLDGFRPVAFSVLGVYLIVNALPDIGSTIGWFWLQLGEEYSDLNPQNYLPGTIKLIVQCLVGVLLCLLPVSLDKLLESFRQWGLRKSQ